MMHENGIEIIEGQWFFKGAYQSTDESDSTPVLDPSTDVEDGCELNVPATRKPWITRPPLYRDPDVSDPSSEKINKST